MVLGGDDSARRAQRWADLRGLCGVCACQQDMNATSNNTANGSTHDPTTPKPAGAVGINLPTKTPKHQPHDSAQLDSGASVVLATSIGEACS